MRGQTIEGCTTCICISHFPFMIVVILVFSSSRELAIHNCAKVFDKAPFMCDFCLIQKPLLITVLKKS